MLNPAKVGRVHKLPGQGSGIRTKFAAGTMVNGTIYGENKTGRTGLLFPFSVAAALVLLSVASGCNSYNDVLKSTDPEYKLERAIGFIDSSQCYGALMVLEDLMGLTRGTSQGREVQFHHARAQYCMGDYYLARYYYKQFARTYPDDPRSEQAQFDAAMCSYRLSPSPSLDQTETRTAIEELQLFMDSYPGSPLRDSCQTLVDNLRDKLERKSFETAALYHKTEQYKSATLALRQAMKDFPDSPFREEMQWLIPDSHFQYATQSTERRKLERYNEAIEAFLSFVARYPNSQYAARAQRIYDASVAEVSRLVETTPSESP